MINSDKNALAAVSVVAVLSDIHSNYYAFKACVDDALHHGAQGFVFLGDYVSDLSELRPTLDLLYEICEKYPAACLRGNRERYMLGHRDGSSHFSSGAGTGSLFYTYERLTSEELTMFENMKFSDTVNVGGVDFEIAHSALDQDRVYFDHKGGTEKIFPQMKCRYFLTGHSHKQYLIEKDGKTIINPGSVGAPHGGCPWPKYAMLEIVGGNVICDLRRVKYDVESVIHAQFASGLVDCGKYWSIAMLYDIMTGNEHCIQLLKNVLARGGSEDEEIWRDEAQKLGMKFTEREILETWRAMKKQLAPDSEP